jgi:hypothetical protein
MLPFTASATDKSDHPFVIDWNRSREGRVYSRERPPTRSWRPSLTPSPTPKAWPPFFFSAPTPRLAACDDMVVGGRLVFEIEIGRLRRLARVRHFDFSQTCEGGLGVTRPTPFCPPGFCKSSAEGGVNVEEVAAAQTFLVGAEARA